MKTTLFAAATALGLIAATAAHAGEGIGEPFPFHVPGMTTATLPAHADTGSAAYPDLTGRPSWVVTAGGPGAASFTGSEGTVQTVNSLPRGFAEGTVAQAQERSVQRHFAAQARRAIRAAQQVPDGGPRG